MSRKTQVVPQLLIVDDDRWLSESMAEWLSSEGYTARTATGVVEAKAELRKSKFDVVLCDVRLGEEDGFTLLQHVRRAHRETPVLMMTGYAGPDSGCEAVRLGAFDLLSKPIIDQELLLAIRRAIEQQSVAKENQQLREALGRRGGLDTILSRDPRMQQIFEVVGAVADTRASVLITGENGTGKSMIARAIHKQSDRRDRPFVEVACGALPDNLLESELFGHAAGAFTGAIAAKPGKFRQADGGTIFLDEIGTASAALQVKLLRVLQELEFEPLGSNETVSIDTRVVLATNENLEQAVAQGTFRQDLFYRVNVIHVELPPLRQRLDDLPMLVDHFVVAAAQQHGREVERITPAAMEILLGHDWPGNIRELENAVQRMVLLTKGDTIDVDVLPLSMLRPDHRATRSYAATPASAPAAWSATPRTAVSSGPAVKPLSDALEEPERRIILDALRAFQWNRSETADALGINRTTLYKKMKRLHIEELEPARPCVG